MDPAKLGSLPERRDCSQPPEWAVASGDTASSAERSPRPLGVAIPGWLFGPCDDTASDLEGVLVGEHGVK